MKRALIVDDSPFTRGILSQHLVSLGFQVETAESGNEAMHTLARRSPPDVILLDWIMPGFSGMDLVDWLKHNSGCEKVPVIMVTAQSDLGHVREALAHGALEYIMKPFSKEAVQEKLRLVGFEV